MHDDACARECLRHALHIVTDAIERLDHDEPHEAYACAQEGIEVLTDATNELQAAFEEAQND